MTVPKVLLTYSELIAEVRRLSHQKRTGTIFITSDNGHLVRMVLKSGRILHLVFDTEYAGYDALLLVPTIKTGHLQFAEKVLEVTPKELVHTPLPSTEEVLQNLETSYRVQPKENLAVPVAKPVSFEQAVNYLKKSLATQIGPFATFVCDEYIEKIGFPKTISEVVAMLENVTQEIGNPKAEDVFKTRVKQEMLQLGLI